MLCLHSLWHLSTRILNEPQNELKDLRQTIARSTNEKLRLFRALGEVLLDAAIDDAAGRAVSFARVPEAVVQAAGAETAGLIRPRGSCWRCGHIRGSFVACGLRFRPGACAIS